ncbi:uncharacterized protein LOC130903753 [Diorhabda carinulata]|uniref:uncharacterized protein LOC130451772 n=1 Tax=Diorhabda sublineata TaxID=1163346 RepID=UPI0024E0FC58|nr:uncharacterized protein LOC130451772 [Diorhabda sublineata]XP_057672031.1 uncharacterized protein LOC130903753 [Diorhabda carinulata]
MDQVEPPTTETVDELRQRLNNMRRLMAERISPVNYNEGRRTTNEGLIDGTFMSFTFGAALVVIISVSVYAFYNLYVAILKKIPHNHDEL